MHCPMIVLAEHVSWLKSYSLNLILSAILSYYVRIQEASRLAVFGYKMDYFMILLVNGEYCTRFEILQL